MVFVDLYIRDKSMKSVHFLSGVPRAGSTYLGALLSQRHDTYVSATSNLPAMIEAVADTWASSRISLSGDDAIEGLYPVIASLIGGKYQTRLEPIIFDKSRAWQAPINITALTKAYGASPKIIAPVRPIAECIASFMAISDWRGTAKSFVRSSPLFPHLIESYRSMKAGYLAHPESFLFVIYKDLCEHPQRECDRVADFLGLPRFTHTLENVINPVPEHDAEVWGIPGLHDLVPKAQRKTRDTLDFLGSEIFDTYQGGEFWPGGAVEVERPTPPLNLALAAALRGDFDVAEENLALCAPTDDRAAFNRGWFALREGALQEGFALLDRGREEKIFGNPCLSSQPAWAGQELNGETVLLQLEGGLGDQICATRFAREITARGGKCVLAGSSELAPLLSRAQGVSAFAEHDAAGGLFHHFHMMGMSGVRPLGWDSGDIAGAPFLPCGNPAAHKRLRVGIRWAGNPQFEHEQHRRFDPTPLLALKGVELVSLQRDDPLHTPLPAHVLQPPLDSWEATAEVIAGLDLVISSCTSVAHLSAAMGKPTWVIIPLLPYYLWAHPGDKTPWYNSVRLFRQNPSGIWIEAFEAITRELENLCAH